MSARENTDPQGPISQWQQIIVAVSGREGGLHLLPGAGQMPQRV